MTDDLDFTTGVHALLQEAEDEIRLKVIAPLEARIAELEAENHRLTLLLKSFLSAGLSALPDRATLLRTMCKDGIG